MKKLTIKEEQLNPVLNKLILSWVDCFNKDTIEKAQVAKSQSRNFMFGTLMNTKFIRLAKSSCGFKVGHLVALTDIYESNSASSITGLIIYRLANSGMLKQPTIVEA